jgi:MFS family permease
VAPGSQTRSSSSYRLGRLQTMSTPLPPAARRLIVAGTFARFGTGLTLPFTVILLHEVRGIPLPTVGLLLALPGIVGLGAVPLSGAMIDRFGPRAVLRSSLVVGAVGNALLAFASSPGLALVALLLVGIGLGPTFPATSALLTSLVEGPEQMQRAFGVQFTWINAAIGAGGLVAASFVDVGRPLTFEVLYLTNALSGLLETLLLPPSRGPVRVEAEGTPEASYREVLSDPVFRRVLGVSLLFGLTGYAALDAGMPAFARVVAHVPPSAVALVFVVNTVVIVGGQLLVLRLLRGWRRSTALAVSAGTWGVAWAALGLVPGLSGDGRIGVVLLFGCLFGIGECFMAPVMQPLVNALASDHLRGRYNALSGLAMSVAFVVSPALSGFLIGNGLGLLWVGLIAGGCLVSATVALRLRHRLSDEQDGQLAVAPEVLNSVGA